jgi:gliding motility-associated-like protein
MRGKLVLIFSILNFYAFSQAPTSPASNITFPFTGCNEFTVSWNKGNGSERVVFVKEGTDFSDVPVNDEFYTDYQFFRKSESIKNDSLHFCVYRGNGTTVTVKGLKKSTKYYVAVFEYNPGGPGKYYYLTSSYPSSNITTKSITADFSISPTAQCFNGNSCSFTNKSICDLSPMSYTWHFGDGDSSKQKDPTHTYKAPGEKKVKLITTAPGCLSSTVISDTLHPHPVAKFDLDPSKLKNDSIQCYFGNRFTFRNGTTLLDIGVGASSMRYEWYADNVYIGNGYKYDKAFPDPGVKNVKLVVISNRGCKDSTFKFYKILPRAIDPSQVIFSEKSRCLSDAKFTFTNNSPSSITHSWYFKDEFSPKNNDSAFGQTVTHTFNKIGKHYVILRSYDVGGCLDQLKDSIDVFSNTNVSFTGLDLNYCLNDPKDILKPTPGKGKFIGTNINDVDSSFTPASIGKFKIGYVYAQGSCRDTAWNTTEVFNRPTVNLGKDTTICKDFPLQLNVNPAFTSTWSNGSTASFINVANSGTFWVKSKDGFCDDTDTIVIKALATPSVSPSRDTTLCGGSFLKFNLKVDDGTVVWNDGSNLRDRNVSQSGFYKYYISNKCGSVSDSFNLTVEETACIIFFPNAFSPNGDILNDTWQPYGKYEFVRMNIYNRWGEQVYFSDKSPVWNGYDNKNLCLDGVYCCVFEYLIQDGNSMKKVTDGLIIHLVR